MSLETDGPRRRRSDWRSATVPLLLFLAGMTMAFYPMLLSGFARTNGTALASDNRLIHFTLEHNHRWLTAASPRAALFSPPIFYPEQNTGAYTEPMLAVTPFYSQWRLAGLSPDSAYQAWMLTVAAINFLCSYLMLRFGLRADPLPASFGAFLFSFGSPRLSQLIHSFLLPHFFTALAILALYRIFADQASDNGCGEDL